MLGRKEFAAFDSDIVAHRHRKGVHHISAAAIVLLEHPSQQAKEGMPQVIDCIPANWSIYRVKLLTQIVSRTRGGTDEEESLY
jgi:hypothetical protein